MPQLQPVVLKDAANPQVEHSFKPREISGGVTTLVESTGIPLADRRITMSLTRNSNGRIKPVIKFSFPVVDDAVVNGVSRPTILRTNYAEVNFNFDSSSTARERDDLATMVKEILSGTSNPMAGGFIVNLEGIY